MRVVQIYHKIFTLNLSNLYTTPTTYFATYKYHATLDFMNKNLLRMLGVVGLLVVLCAAYVASLYWRASHSEDSRTREEKQLEVNAQQYYADVAANTKVRLAKEATDTYGGATPEETWRLFIAALVREDVELAAKYFVVDKQEEMKSFLESEKVGKTLSRLLYHLKQAADGKYSTSKDIYTLYSPATTGSFDYDLQINPQTHVWKIISL
jgi:hypothetical protein